ncbi:MFS transporter [Streptomyces purpureus]|uniref:MFS transporter n=1 Tax=Streptomyces purpureus TaxID=1951 RepID=A0A918H205_9ACTN|nr:MFS transporter [Streptomyces purpureus]
MSLSPVSRALFSPGGSSLVSAPRTPVPVLVLAVAGAVTVGNLYFPQPLLEAVARGMDVSANTAGFIASSAQIGYALGILLLVPLADTVNLRRLTTVLLALTCAGLLVAAAAPNALTLAVATLALSTTTVLPQVLTPVGAALAGPGRRGQVVGLIGLGLTLGSTASRSVSGALFGLSGSWRTAYVVAAVATAALLFVLPRRLPRHAGRRGARLPYGRLLGTLPRLLAAHREVRLAAAGGAAVFAAFSVFWATLPFHLAAPPLELGAAFAGLFGLLTLPGALLSAGAGRFTDRYGPRVVCGWSLGCVAVAFVVLGAWGDSAVALALGANLLVLGTSGSQVANQARVFALGDAIAARVNTLFMLASFGGGALGTLTATWLYGAYGWSATVLTAGAFVAVAFAVVAAAGVRGGVAPGGTGDGTETDVNRSGGAGSGTGVGAGHIPGARPGI